MLYNLNQNFWMKKTSNIQWKTNVVDARKELIRNFFSLLLSSLRSFQLYRRNIFSIDTDGGEHLKRFSLFALFVCYLLKKQNFYFFGR